MFKFNLNLTCFKKLVSTIKSTNVSNTANLEVLKWVMCLKYFMIFLVKT